MNDSKDSQRQRLETLQLQLATRVSILHFAHAVISGLLGCVLTLTWERLTREGRTDLTAWVLGLSAFLWLYALVRTVLGHRARRVEDLRFAELLELRRSLQLENPAMLLPR